MKKNTHKIFRHLFVLTAILFSALCSESFAVSATEFPNIDRTCTDCDRRYLDSMNVYHRRAIRVNQSGYRPQDTKYAFVADPSVKTFKIVDAVTQLDVGSSRNLSLIGDAIKPNIWVNGAFKSIATLYNFGSKDSTSKNMETLYKADFSDLTTIGEYFLVSGNDTSATFHVHPSIYNAIFENSLKFFGIQRCGNTKSQLHAACHLKDGSEIGHDLTGGWHDCGDHFKVSETLSYAAYALATTYLVYQDKAEDRYGNSYDDTVFTDGIPDILYEAKIGADYIYKLYKASKADGLIAQHDMYHSVAVGSEDHQFWDVPEKQEAQPQSKGGPDRHVAKGAGTVSGMFAAALAYFAVGWQVYDADYADSLLEAAKDIYANVLKPTYPSTTNELLGFYPGSSSITNMIDDAAAAALALWYATKDSIYQYDLYKNTTINDNSTNYTYNNEPNDAGPYFKAGFLGLTSGFYPGGWMTDFENVHAYVLFSFAKLILQDKNIAQSYGVGELERDTLLQRATNSLRRLTDDGSQGDSTVYKNRFGALKVTTPYNLVWTSSDWGFNRYNMGAANAIFMMSELATGEEKQRYLDVALANIYYNLGINPWDISFLMGAGDKNSNHPHNRAANPDGYNAGGTPYKYRCPKGALMGGSAPNKVLLEDWEDYTATETCIDFSVQLLMPAQSLAETLPIDAEGPLFSNIAGTPISDSSAIISWDANEISLVTIFYNTTPNSASAQQVQQKKATKGGAVTLNGLIPGETYYFYLEGMDTKRNISTDDNHGQWYQFTMIPTATTISGVTICQVDHRSAKIYWWSSNRMNGVVNYGPSMSNLTESQVAEGGAVLFHEAKLTNLKAGTTYYFTVSSGTATDDNGGIGYTFTTDSYATYADLDISVKPSAYQDLSECSTSKGWQNCSEFIVQIVNNDTVAFEDFELRFYLGTSSNMDAVSYIKQNFDGTGLVVGMPDISFGTPTADSKGEYYLPISVKSKLYVSGRLIFQLKFTNAKFSSMANGWSVIPHMDEDAPEKFKGLDLTQAPYFVNNESEELEKDASGTVVVAFSRDPYIPVYYHGKHIYGYGPDYTPENGPQTPKTVTLNFTSPFVTPRFSLETDTNLVSYQTTCKVTPTGFLDDFEINGSSRFSNIVYTPLTRRDAFSFRLDSTLSYGNNYIEFVGWHNHSANKNNSYDCACDVVRSNVEIDTIINPPEPRYLIFTVDTVEAFVGKMVEVHVELYDSALYLAKNEPLSILLSSESGLAKFFNSSSDVIPVETITIVNGEATFYLLSDTPTETILKATANNTKTYVYTPATAVLSIKELPPWPLIETALMVDTDCDNIPDAFNITLSNEYSASTQQSFNSISFTYNGENHVSNTIISQNGKNLVVAANLTEATTNTNPSGTISLNSNIGGQQISTPDFYQDGVAPILESVSILEKLDPTDPTDHVFLQFSEPVKSPDGWPLILTPTNNPITVQSITPANEEHSIWEFVIASGDNGESLVKEGMNAQLNPSSSIIDLAGNGLSTCTPNTVPVILKIRPIPMVYASISDPDEDGIASHVRVVFSQPVNEKHIPDSISVIFGSVAPETLNVAKSQLLFDATYTEANIELNPAFSLGKTNGNYSGTVLDKNLVGAGLAIQHLGFGAAYERDSIFAEDLVGPIFVAASLENEGITSVTLTISEPVTIIDSSAILFLRERESKSFYSQDIYSWSYKNTTLSAIDTNSKFIMEGDRIRFAPLKQSAFIDKNFNMPATHNPWVTIEGKADPEIDFNIYLTDNVNRINQATATATTDVPSMRLYVENALTHKLDMIDTETGTVIASIDTVKNPLNGVVWVFDLTVPRGTSYNKPAAWSSMRVKYDLLVYSNLGSFVNKLSGTYDVESGNYLSSANKVTLFVEWVNTVNIGIRSKDGNAVGTGAYIYKANLKTKFTPDSRVDAETQERFSLSDSFDKTKIFGIKRIR